MPMATATMPASPMGVSKQRVRPCFFCKPSVTRKTPPKNPTSSPKVRTLGSRVMVTSSAEFNAWIMFMVGTASDSQFLALTAQMPGHVLEYVLEHRFHAGLGFGAQRAERHRFSVGGLNFVVRFLSRLDVLRIRPFAELGKMAFQALDRIAQRPFLAFVRGAIAVGIVARGMAFDAIGVKLDHRRAVIGARAIRGPLCRGIDCEKIVAVDAQTRNAVTYGARSERRALTAGDTRETRNRPLIVDHIQDHWRAIDTGEIHRVMEITLGGGAFADPARGDARVALVGRRHRPADGLGKLRAQISGNGEESKCFRRVHDRKLAAL